ncbi:uncharacterized protein [Ptychodera flava]|uniref:uncharacterized protein n=1 Tax=Ptychodera flava TaxID=63121 RepID=UPI00396AAA9E
MATSWEDRQEKAWMELKTKISREIKPDEFLKTKTSSIDKRFVAERDLGHIASTLILLEKLEPKKFASLENLLTLIDILEDIGRTDLVLEVIEILEKVRVLIFFESFKTVPDVMAYYDNTHVHVI